jgi:ribosomal protein S18 acetylase RimI-like enzyme
MKIRKTKIDDFEELYALGKNTPELIVSADEEFMEAKTFKGFITDKNCVFLLAESEKKIIGFILAHTEWVNLIAKDKYVYLCYLAVAPEFRRQGVASKLYSECIAMLKKKGATSIYSWANADSDDSIAHFLEKQGFAKGHKYVWMDRKI